MQEYNIKKALLHLKKDKILADVIIKFPAPDLKRGADYFKALVRSIIHQQLSGKAAGTIEKRFVGLFKNGIVIPGKVLKLSDIEFRKAGVSGQKMKYLRDLSVKFQDGTIEPPRFARMPDEEIRTHLISVKGIGPWTADMFLMFTLNRPDVLPTGDLGIQKGFKIVFKLKKLPDTKRMIKLSDNWRPFRTIASMYLWKVADLYK